MHPQRPAPINERSRVTFDVPVMSADLHGTLGLAAGRYTGTVVRQRYYELATGSVWTVAVDGGGEVEVSEAPPFNLRRLPDPARPACPGTDQGEDGPCWLALPEDQQRVMLQFQGRACTVGHVSVSLTQTVHPLCRAGLLTYGQRLDGPGYLLTARGHRWAQPYPA